MRVSREREKLINAMVFFAKNTHSCGKIKLFKLLYLLDFRHFAETGLSVTGLEYRAWKNGPVPRALYDEWDNPESEIRKAVQIKKEVAGNYVRQAVTAVADFDDEHFTKRELRLMSSLAEEFRHHTATPMVDTTHVADGAWAKVWAQPGDDNVIPYELAIPKEDPNRDEILRTAEEYSRIRV
ncbi:MULTISPECIES: Panacea domain-containing protein [Rhodanobacter]|uniref:Panacea domain-containing protein n=1 Tax=Rhodanobacter TaxID=75309 RepID=UPI00047F66F0|nr:MULTISPECIES: Panacea domain-containing protein [Rhodanobacter]TAN18788.1 MAG: DUF4065 domain-containing protein [Rhodanobacter sp.]UJJ55017.1 SocA family protein [Rhodanobacter thiooxydans]